MRVAALYDIHGNLPALDAVLAEVRQTGVDLLVVGGDVVPGPLVRDSLDRLLRLDIEARFIRGNGEVAVLAELAGRDPGVPEQARDAVRWSARELGPGQSEVLAGWPLTVSVDIQGLGEVLFCHATPRNEREIFTRLTSEERLLQVFAGVSARLVVCGHTHMQFDRVVGRTRVVNAGSVGMPFGVPGGTADWLLLGPGVELRRTWYDLFHAVELIRCSNYPQGEDFIARYVLQTPSEDVILAAFSKVELAD